MTEPLNIYTIVAIIEDRIQWLTKWIAYIMYKQRLILKSHILWLNKRNNSHFIYKQRLFSYTISQSIRSQNVHLLSHTDILTNKRLSNTVISITDRQSNVPTWSLLVIDDGSWVSSDDRRRRCRFTADLLMSRRWDHSTFWLCLIHVRLVRLDSSLVQLLLVDAVICR